MGLCTGRVVKDVSNILRQLMRVAPTLFAPIGPGDHLMPHLHRNPRQKTSMVKSQLRKTVLREE